jgi:cystathionine beta-lyase/cystathionine gamma-synthase
MYLGPPIKVNIMTDNKMNDFIKNILENMPDDWLNLTTHRLDIYDESQAKTEFLKQFEILYNNNDFKNSSIAKLPTAYDYIRLGHPLSCVLEWLIAHLNDKKSENIISFSSRVIPIIAILRKNLLDKKNTQIIYSGELPDFFDPETLRSVYNYNFDLIRSDDMNTNSAFNGSTIYLLQQNNIYNIDFNSNIDFYITFNSKLGSVLYINSEKNENYISDIQHSRRRETIAMTPANCFTLIQSIVNQTVLENNIENKGESKINVLKSIKDITQIHSNAIVASSGLSIQYAIMMGLVHDAIENHKGKAIKFIVPSNCYGGTNDQARRIASCNKNIEVLDLFVDGDNNMVNSIELMLKKIANEDGIPYIIAEIPTNPRVEVPDLIELKNTLYKERLTKIGAKAVKPVFVLDQTFCPNVNFIGEGKILDSVPTIAYVSGSKFPSGGKCTAGYCIGNTNTKAMMAKIQYHLNICDNEATDLQYDILAKQMPSMKQRIHEAYINTVDFVKFINIKLPNAKINFVSEELAQQGFTPSVFSLDLPTKGESSKEKEDYKRQLNHKLINLMITKIPNQSKYCVSYGQLNGCYWTIPATSTQGTTKEGDKDYIARVSISPNINLEKHKEVFLEFVNGL